MNITAQYDIVSTYYIPFGLQTRFYLFVCLWIYFLSYFNKMANNPCHQASPGSPGRESALSVATMSAAQQTDIKRLAERLSELRK